MAYISGWRMGRTIRSYSYDSGGVYQSAQDFNLTSGNTSANGITWDGTYFRVVDNIQ